MVLFIFLFKSWEGLRLQLEPGTRGRLEWLHVSRDCGVVGRGYSMIQIGNFGAIFSAVVFFSILKGNSFM